MIKQLLFAVLLAVATLTASAQGVDEVTLTVCGNGTTKEEATHAALRSAIEQTFGVFVSANTTILNDELVKDEIATVSSGNIKTFVELGSTVLPDGLYSMMLKATVSVGKLVSYAKSKGSECELDGATFGANLKLLQLKYENSLKAFEDLKHNIESIGPEAFDYNLTLTEPIIEKGVVKMTGYVNLSPNDNTERFYQYVMSTIEAISFSDQEKSQIDNMTTLNSEKFSEQDLTLMNEMMKNQRGWLYQYAGYWIPGFINGCMYKSILLFSIIDNNQNNISYKLENVESGSYYRPNWKDYNNCGQTMASIEYHMLDYYIYNKNAGGNNNTKKKNKGVKNSKMQSLVSGIDGVSNNSFNNEELDDFYNNKAILSYEDGKNVFYKSKSCTSDHPAVRNGASAGIAQTVEYVWQIPISSMEITFQIPLESFSKISKLIIEKPKNN